MNEVEVKILEKNHQDLEPKLLELGAKKIFDDELHAIFFDTTEQKIKNSDETFRLRKEGENVFLTHKKKIPSNEVKIRDETEIKVSSFDETKKLILALGYLEKSNMRKHRVSYKLDNIKIEFDKLLDEYDYVPEFMEIEATNVNDIYKYIELLGYLKEDCKAWTGKDVIKYYSKN